ncbi:MAG: topoisomerase C-terminal repeat-containing protein [Clostridia bacterium]|nr:topoisomerase C-terminal repeat-containing protein [Clostridia bacterium]
MKALLIAEKPSLRREIETVYKKHKSEIPYEITFMEQRGHLLTLKNPTELDDTLKKWDWDTLPIHPEEYGGWQYKTISEKKTGKFLTSQERFEAIKKELNSGEYDFVINAGDPDQEGELLIRIVLSALRNKLPVKRYWTNALTEEKILEALKNLRDDDREPELVHLLDAAYARQHSDWRFGMNISRAATLKMGARCACGRVKTPILSIVCKREKEIANFVPSSCYGVKALYAEGFEGQLFDEGAEAESEEKDDAQKGLIWFDTEDEANDLIKSLSSPAKVVKYESKREESYAPKLFKLATAQIAAGKLGYNSAQTLEIIQSLYEKGYLSYPRTDCEYIASGENLKACLKSASSISEFKPFIDSITGPTIGKVLHTKKWVNDEKLKESGHSAIIPTEKRPDFESLTEDEQKIYKLVCKQFVAIFLPPLIQNKTVLISEIDGNTFKSAGKTLIDEGYTKIFNKKFEDMVVPEHSEGDILDVNSFETVVKTTTCPKRYTDASLTAACENPVKYTEDASLKGIMKKLKIGTPATRASIIQELIEKDKYLAVTKEKKAQYIVPTPAGMIIYDNLKDCGICKVDMTGEWEEQLESIRTGKLDLKDFESSMMKDVASMVDEIKALSVTALRGNREKICDCPKCGGDIFEGPKGFFCSNYKEKGCGVGGYKLASIYKKPLSKDEMIPLLEGKTIKKTMSKNGNDWEQEIIYNFDENKIDFVKSEKPDREHVQMEESEWYCPKCGEPLQESEKIIKCRCGFKLFKTTCGHTLTEDEIDSFFSNGTTGIIRGLVGKSGKSFDAEFVLNKDKTGSEFKFEERS